MARGVSNDIINGSLVFRLDGRNTDSNAYLTDAVNGTICNILNTGYTKTDNGVVVPKDSSACIEIPSLNTNHGKHHENANYEVRVIK